MLGIIGFFVLAVTLGLYAYTSYTNYTLVPMRDKSLLVTAYTLLALTSLVWLATLFASEAMVRELVFLSDVLLIAATACMLGILADLSKPLVLSAVAFAAAGLLTLRAYALPTQAFVGDGLLNFNLSQTEAVVIGLVFLAVWLPASVKVVQLALSTPKLEQLRGPVSFMFMATILMTSFFLTARRPLTIIASFVSITMLFMLLVTLNVYIGSLVRSHKKQKVDHHG